MKIFNRYLSRYEESREETLSLHEYLELCKTDSNAYASAPERLLKAIGEPSLVDTRDDPRLSRIFQNKVLKLYPAFEEFYGMEDAIEQIVSYLRHAAQGLEEKKQILYLLGPVGGGKSSLAERLKQLMEKVPFYAIADSPVFESPLGLFNPDEDGPILEEDFGIPRRITFDERVVPRLPASFWLPVGRQGAQKSAWIGQHADVGTAVFGQIFFAAIDRNGGGAFRNGTAVAQPKIGGNPGQNDYIRFAQRLAALVPQMQRVPPQ